MNVNEDDIIWHICNILFTHKYKKICGKIEQGKDDRTPLLCEIEPGFYSLFDMTEVYLEDSTTGYIDIIGILDKFKMLDIFNKYFNTQEFWDFIKENDQEYPNVKDITINCRTYDCKTKWIYKHDYGLFVHKKLFIHILSIFLPTVCISYLVFINNVDKNTDIHINKLTNMMEHFKTLSTEEFLEKMKVSP